MDPAQVEAVFKKLKNLSQSKNKTDTELYAQAEEIVKVDDLSIDELFSEKDEKKKAKELAKKYLKDWTPETISEVNALQQLVYFEIVQIRLQSLLNDSHTQAKTVPLRSLESLHKNITEITSLKDKLGISRDNKLKQQKDAFQILENLKKKYKVWCSNNQASREFACESCGQMNLLRILPDKWEAQKHPFFKDRVLGNDHLIRLYQDGKITKDDVGLILECPSDYVDWLIEKWNLTNLNPSS